MYRIMKMYAFCPFGKQVTQVYICIYIYTRKSIDAAMVDDGRPYMHPDISAVYDPKAHIHTHHTHICVHAYIYIYIYVKEK